MQTNYTPEEIEKLWGNIDKEVSITFYNGSRCWEWIAGYFDTGYGSIWAANKNRGAHRVSYELAFGEIQDGLFVLHRCDNRRCCNPAHLFLGTNKDNMEDRNKKGRMAYGERHGSRLHPDRMVRGEDHPQCKLSDEQIAEIRQRYASGKETQRDLAKMFGVGQSQIQRILKYESRA